jgi:hemoglobin
MAQRDISSLEDIQHMVNSFYATIQLDEVLGPIFNGVIQDRWPAHLEKMYRFWQTILLSEHTYSGSPFAPHAKLPIDKAHFNRWMGLFTATIDAHFVGPVADEAKRRAQIMADTFSFKIDYLRQQDESSASN